MTSPLKGPYRMVDGGSEDGVGVVTEHEQARCPWRDSDGERCSWPPHKGTVHRLESIAGSPVCAKGGTWHRVRDHGLDGHEHPHNPWSEACVKRLQVEPWCPDARCMTCDGGRRGAR